ncbi:MAG: hypothetical protein A3D67_04425 [Candidatus Lloydbacteria bacterium RIFCSPHIGHO2_02_FULL_51_22]|uniref:Uncharacterized protein n=3 Tax=Candidatus Lloydiibacteriota TaxID=1817910 RepID=A0A1G2DIB9_9BACT|nr:MAG: hypothetical protein A3D67_04425 [Candidatus Lloydbacteria bacterium RIFCSPHIGHO2_02_FULL_51_22]OGZ14232.1 MAG: hypothetical protein A3J08_03585 [Candidatus Lloydbacteria bacterium RIFCSPLOWO2_02_FULL_51_11]OGZ16784.1 MAG: hypothetical protein A3G11_02860 [Candidatus Lloydbacteria bacterium RIFCSPLOWO2_12_FULL_51_9]
MQARDMEKNYKELFKEKYALFAEKHVLKYAASFRARWNRTEGIFALLALVAVSVFFFVGYVKADTSTTSVIVGNSAPTLTVSLDRSTIILSENTYTWASTTLTITDGNGCATINKVEASLVFASTTADMGANICGRPNSNYLSWDENYCIMATTASSTGGCMATTTGDTCSDGSLTVGEWDCGFQVWFTGTPTDASAPYANLQSARWFVVGSTTDNVVSASATNTAQTIEVATLNALNVTGTITYPETAAGADTGATNQTATVTNTGNTVTDTEISGTALCSDGGTCASPATEINDDNQKFGLVDDTYASLTNNLSSTTPATIETVLATTTATSTTITDATFWGVAIDSGQPNSTYTGTQTFTAVAD